MICSWQQRGVEGARHMRFYVAHMNFMVHPKVQQGARDPRARKDPFPAAGSTLGAVLASAVQHGRKLYAELRVGWE